MSRTFARIQHGGFPMPHFHLVSLGLSADGLPDEILAEGANVHIERMDTDQWWMKIEQDGCRLVLMFYGVEDVSADRDCCDGDRLF
jgi:hypothetical protein